MGEVGAFVTDSDVKLLHDRIAQEWAAVAAAASNASSKLSQGQLSELGLLASRVQAMNEDAPSFWRAASQMDTGAALEKDIFAYASELSASGIPGMPAQPSPAPESALDKLASALPLVLLAVIVVSLSKGGK